MMQSFELSLCYILHQRPFKETSVLLDVFSLKAGRISLIAKGAKRPKSPLKSCLQLFTPLLLAWRGKHELMNITAADTAGAFIFLPGKSLLSALYVNELLTKLLPFADPEPELFGHYQHCLQALTQVIHIERTLRLFEKRLLKAIGYELSLERDALSGLPLDPQAYYYFDPEVGVCLREKHDDSKQSFHYYTGEMILALHHEMLEDIAILKAVKQLTRTAIAKRLGHQVIESRKLFSYG